MNVREESTQKRHEELMSAMDRDATIREKDHEINVGRDKRERWLLVLAIGSLLVALSSLWIAGTALRISCLHSGHRKSNTVERTIITTEDASIMNTNATNGGIVH